MIAEYIRQLRRQEEGWRRPSGSSPWGRWRRSLEIEPTRKVAHSLGHGLVKRLRRVYPGTGLENASRLIIQCEQPTRRQQLRPGNVGQVVRVLQYLEYRCFKYVTRGLRYVQRVPRLGLVEHQPGLAGNVVIRWGPACLTTRISWNAIVRRRS